MIERPPNSLEISFLISRSLKRSYEGTQTFSRTDGPENESSMTVEIRGKMYEIKIKEQI